MEETSVQQQLRNTPPTHTHIKQNKTKILRWLWAVMSTKAGQKGRVMSDILDNRVRVSLLKKQLTLYSFHLESGRAKCYTHFNSFHPQHP